MPDLAHERLRSGSLAALLLLLGALLGSGAAAADYEARSSAARLGAERQVAAHAALRTAVRDSLPDDEADPDRLPYFPPPRPAVVRAAVESRPADAGPAAESLARPRRGSAPYRARAPPPAS